MGLFDIDLYSGDPVVREWFLVKSNFWPLALCGTYALVGKYIGIWLMKDRQPFNLRIPMLIYNAFVVVSYIYLLAMAVYYLPQIERKLLCSQSNLEGELPLKLVKYGWLCYLLKYVEFFDTIFFILRKKNHLLTNLHIIHHTIIPLVGWLLLRTERSGYQAFPVIINGMVHVLMYTYYGMAALGPEIRKYLWWKKYLTMIQMAQFIIIGFFILIFTPLSGCSTVKGNAFIIVILTIFFFGLFYNYFYHSFIKESKMSDSKAERVIRKDIIKKKH